MGLLLILPILVSGYIYCHGSIYHQATLSRYDGQLLYMLIAKTGLFLFAIAAIVSFALLYASKHGYFQYVTPDYADYAKYVRAFLVRYGIADEAGASLWVFFGQASVLSFFFAWLFPRVFPFLLMVRYRIGPAKAKALVLNSLVPLPPLTKHLLGSISDEDSLYMFSMEDRKVYVGRVSSVGDLHEAGLMDEDFEIVPTMSGYRDKDTLKVTYTTDYSAVVEDMELSGREIGFTILLSQKNIVSISRFEPEVWARFKARQDGTETNHAYLERLKVFADGL
ncbi:hypothetical protein [Pseudomonas sp. Marseille-Q5115]|uniref:hypothetical protein n=1 Tax=Pseudomonas sp. Marseille-Q5115 TaxID=2866593 RepID=UPI001CE41FCF|nr:hypothetical protein [Pseudomonas sp. Marseille-Q5115]